MVRKQRVWFQGAKFHITSRGIRKYPLFYDDHDRFNYLSFLLEMKEQHPFLLHSYCLMTNHIHLQMEVIHTSPSIIIKNLNTKYAKYFNKQYDFTGHVFESRFGSEMITSIDYELETSRYIHLNPVKAELVKNPEDYPWSSYSTYLSREDNPLITTSSILSYFPDPSITHYEQYIHQKLVYPLPTNNEGGSKYGIDCL